MMGDASLLFGRNLASADIKATIYLTGIKANDLGVPAKRDLDSEITLPARRWPYNTEQPIQEVTPQ